VNKLYAERVQDLDAESLKDAKTQLQELLQGRGRDLPVYEVEYITGADHQRQYSVSCSVAALEQSASASASSRRGAEKAAAQLVLAQVRKQGTDRE
jgi:ribonuclease-3